MGAELWLFTIPLRLRSLFRRAQVDQELDDELRDHLEGKTAEYIAKGMIPEEARRQARVDLGGIQQTKEKCHDVRGLDFLDTLPQDVRFGLRMLSRNPGFAATAILTLALGIGATTAIFSVVDCLLLRRLPFPTADRLVRIQSLIVGARRGTGIASYPDFLDWRAQNQSFDGMAVFETKDFTLIGPREPVHLQGAVVSAQLFSLLGVTPAFGRSFLLKEDNPATANGTDPVILSYGLWQREFGADPSVLGRSIRLGDKPFTVVGVMPRLFQFPVQAEPVELWTTIATEAQGGTDAMTANRGEHFLDVVAILKRGVALERAQAEMVTIASSLSKQHPEIKPRTVQIVPEIQAIVGPLRTPLFVLLGAVACVLLIVCANLANLLLARAVGRHKEMAVRAALGASRGRVLRQLLTESLMLGLLGGGVGLALALGFLKLLVRLLPVVIPRLNSIGLDARLLGFTFVISLFTGILFGIAPALRVSKIGLTESLRESREGSASRGRGRDGVRKALVVSEVALASVLLPCAALLLQSFVYLTHADPGFDPHHVVTFRLDSPAGRPSPLFFREVVTRVRTLPGVSSASAVASLPLTGDNIKSSIEIEGQPTPMRSRPSANFNAVEPNYLRTVGIALVAGRDFTDHDDAKSSPVVIVNRTLASRFFPHQDPIGRHVRPGISNGDSPGGPPMREIVGVIGDVEQTVVGAEPAPEVYAPLAQSPFQTMFVVVRAAIDAQSIVDPARLQVASVDKDVPVYRVQTLDDYFEQSVAVPGFVALLVSTFAGLAVLLASVGVYGVMSYIVVRATHEIGVRVALGAKQKDVLKLVVGQGARLTTMGLAIGMVGSLALTRLLSSMLYGVKATDPLTFVFVSIILTVVALIATYIPARRALKIDPMMALRCE
jgi:putative ABC transport system permease protein